MSENEHKDKPELSKDARENIAHLLIRPIGQVDDYIFNDHLRICHWGINDLTFRAPSLTGEIIKTNSLVPSTEASHRCPFLGRETKPKTASNI